MSNNNKKIIKPKMKSVTYLGETIRYRKLGALAKRLKISEKRALKLINEDKTKYLIDNTGNIKRFQLSENPLFLQDFNIGKVENKRLISSKKYKIKNTVILDEIPDNIPVKLKITIELKFWVSEYQYGDIRVKTYFITTTVKNLNNKIDRLAYEYVKSIDFEADYEMLNVVIHSTYSEQLMNLTDGKLRDVKPLKLFYEEIEPNQYKDCVRDYLKKIYKKMAKKTIDGLGDASGVSTEEIYEFCKKYNILMIAYDINGKPIKKNIPDTKNKNYRNLIYIAHNNHLYPLKNKYLHSIKNNSDNIKLIDDADRELKNFLDEGVEPFNIYTTHKDDPLKFIKCFDVVTNEVSTTYLENPDYNRCFSILKSFGIEEKITKFTTLMNIADLILPLYNTKDNEKINIDSFMPQHTQFIKGGYGFNRNIKKEDYKNVKVIDKNKCYSYCISKLPFLIQLDIRQSKITKFTEDNQPSEKKIIPHYLYIAYVNKSSILLPNNNVYSGDHLLFAKKSGCEFIIKEEITTNKKFNYFKPMIDDIYKKCNNTDAKWLLNVFIGKFERALEINKKSVVDRLCNEEESKTISGFKRRVHGTDYYIIENEKETYNLFTQKPISIQIKDYSRKTLYEKLIELKIPESSVVKIKTDSISFLDLDDIMENIDLDKNNIDSWKEEIFKPSDDKINICNMDGLTFEMSQDYENAVSEFYDCYAGVGKSYYISNELIPKLMKDSESIGIVKSYCKKNFAKNIQSEESRIVKSYNYIVLTPSHSTIEDYRKDKYNCDVIQKYSFGGRCNIPKEKNIIIDEIGLCDRNALNVIHKCILAGKNIYAFGDFKQLLPVMENSAFDNKTYLNAVYTTHKNLNKNMRNDFKFSYYDKLINGDLSASKEVKKHQTKNPFDAEVVICYRNKTCDIYNAAILKNKGFKTKFDVGVPLMCKTNKLRHKNVYNNFILTIKSVKKTKVGEIFILGNENNDDDKEFTREEIKEFFKLSYARTAYGVQGKSFLSYHYAKEDKEFLKNNGRLAYTIISRLKTKFY